MAVNQLNVKLEKFFAASLKTTPRKRGVGVVIVVFKDLDRSLRFDLLVWTGHCTDAL